MAWQNPMTALAHSGGVVRVAVRQMLMWKYLQRHNRGTKQRCEWNVQIEVRIWKVQIEVRIEGANRGANRTCAGAHEDGGADELDCRYAVDADPLHLRDPHDQRHSGRRLLQGHTVLRFPWVVDDCSLEELHRDRLAARGDDDVLFARRHPGGAGAQVNADHASV